MIPPEVAYARNGGVHIAYQTVGDGPRDLLLAQGLFSHLDHQWELPAYADFLRRLASFARLVMFDPRGSGLSDRALDLPPLEDQMDDVSAVLAAAGSDRPVLVGMSQSGLMAMLYAATYPDRVSGLVLYGAYPTAVRDADFPWGRSSAWLDEWARVLDEGWGTGATLAHVAPTALADPAFRRWWARFERLASSPGSAVAFATIYGRMDVREVLASIRVPTLVLQRRDDVYRAAAIGRYLADRIDGAQLVLLEGVDHLPYVGDADAIATEIQAFVTGVRPPRQGNRVLATVLFTDIVGSTERAAALGDSAWADLLRRHHSIVREAIARHRGREIDTAGDGFLATFDGPARAVRAALEARDSLAGLDIAIRAGVHTGEVELDGGEVRGLAVHIGSRISALARAGEVLVSGTARDLAVGSDLEFEDRGRQALKGIPGDWAVFSAAARASNHS